MCLSPPTSAVQTRLVPAFRALLLTLAILLLAGACGGGGSGNATISPGVSPTPSAEASATATPSGAALQRVTFYGADEGDQAAAIVSGDFNGDGVQDVVMGADLGDGPDNKRRDSGEAYLFLGPFQPGSSLDAAAGDYDAVFYGAAAGDNFARTLIAGDFNHDGTEDLAIGAPSASGQAGAVYVMFGAEWPHQTDFASTDPDVLIRGAGAGDFAGIATAAGDLDADGITDLAIGALLADGPQGDRADAGAVYVVNGRQLLPGDTIDLQGSTSAVYGARPGDHLGESLTTGDLNGDGKADLLAVATFSGGPDGSRGGAGETYIIDSPATLPIDLATAATQFQVLGADPGDQLGHSIAVGDTNGDGAGDIWLGAVSADGPNNQLDLAGEAALVLGGAARTGLLDAASGGMNATIYGAEAEARLGRSLASGDLNNDGKADLLVSAPNVAERAGKVFGFYGGGPYPADTSGAEITLTGTDPGDLLGHESFGQPSLGIADVDGDGETDVLVAAPGGDGPDNGRAACGEAYLILGPALSG